MKGIITVAVVLLFVSIVNAQLMNFDPYPAMARIDSETAVLVRSLLREVGSPTKKCLLQSKKEIFEDVWESLIVVETQGLRFSVYYEASDYYQISGIFNQDWDSKLTIYVRPERSEGPDSLQIFRDDYINGSWDRAWVDGQELDGEYLYDSKTYDDVQMKYICYLQMIIAYFEK